MPTTFDSYDSFRTPIVVLRVGGQGAPDLSARIINMKYTDSHQIGGKKRTSKASSKSAGASVDKLELLISDPSHELTGDDRLKTDTRWDVRWGYPDDLSDMRWFLLKYYEPDYDTTGFHTKKLMLYGSAITLTAVRAPRNWGRVSSSAVAKQIATRHNLKAMIEDSKDANETMHNQPVGVSDFEYLNELAMDIDFEFFIENDSLYFRSRDTAYNEDPRARLIYGAPGSILLTFKPTVKATPDLTVSAKTADTKGGDSKHPSIDNTNVGGIHLDADVVKSINDTGRALTGMKIQAGPPITSSEQLQARYDQLQRDHDIPKVKEALAKAQTKTPTVTKINAEDGSRKVVPIAGSTSAVVKTAETNPKKVEAIAKAIKRDYLAATVEATAECYGTPRIRARANFNIILPDPVLSGAWYAEETTHTISDKGYRVSAKFHRGALAKAKKGADANNRKSVDKKTENDGSGSGKRTVRIVAETGQVLDPSGVLTQRKSTR